MRAQESRVLSAESSILAQHTGNSAGRDKERIKMLDFAFAVQQHHNNLLIYRKINAITEATAEFRASR